MSQKTLVIIVPLTRVDGVTSRDYRAYNWLGDTDDLTREMRDWLSIPSTYETNGPHVTHHDWKPEIRFDALDPANRGFLLAESSWETPADQSDFEFQRGKELARHAFPPETRYDRDETCPLAECDPCIDRIYEITLVF